MEAWNVLRCFEPTNVGKRPKPGGPCHSEAKQKGPIPIRVKDPYHRLMAAPENFEDVRLVVTCLCMFGLAVPNRTLTSTLKGHASDYHHPRDRHSVGLARSETCYPSLMPCVPAAAVYIYSTLPVTVTTA